MLRFFGNYLGEARRRYRQFVKNGVDQGSRPELQGGGLVRSAGGKKAALIARKKEEREKGDERILGNGGFVGRVLEEADELEERRVQYKISIHELIERVTEDIVIDIRDLMSSKRGQNNSTWCEPE